MSLSYLKKIDTEKFFEFCLHLELDSQWIELNLRFSNSNNIIRLVNKGKNFIDFIIIIRLSFRDKYITNYLADFFIYLFFLNSIPLIIYEQLGLEFLKLSIP